MTNIPQNFLFRFRFPCRRATRRLVDAARGRRLAAEALEERYRIPFWTLHAPADRFSQNPRAPRAAAPRSPENENLFDFRAAWAPEGFAFTAVLRGKKEMKPRPTWELNVADRITICLDARDVKDVRRAGKFCHKFYFYPCVGVDLETARPVAQWAPISRAKEGPNPVDVDEFALAAEYRPDGYAASAFIPANELTGYDPEDFARLGFHFSARDDEFGAFDLQHSAIFPIEEDPSLWASLEFVE